MSELTMDFETRGVVNLKDCGSFVYAEHPLTEPQCLGVKRNTDAPLLWAPPRVRKIINPKNIQCRLISDAELISLVEEADKVVAQNSMFEYLIWNWRCTKLYGWPEIPLEKFHDTMAQLAYRALPQGLEQACDVLRLHVQKDMTGNRVMKKLCKPRNPKKAEKKKIVELGYIENPNGSWSRPGKTEEYWLWHEGKDPLEYTPSEIKKGAGEPPDWNEMETTLNYCLTDVDAEHLLHHSLPKLPARERDIWLMDQRINLRGVRIDHASVDTIAGTVKAEELKQLELFQEATGGAVSGPRSYVKLKEWVNERTGRGLRSVDKEATEKLLDEEDLPPDVREALTIKSQLSKSSVAKFAAMTRRSNKDGRVRGWAVYHGASTGRWSAQGLQLHNNPRDSYGPEDYDYVVQLMADGQVDLMEILYDTPYFVGSRCVRGSVVSAPGKQYVCSDFSAVEGRGNAYLAGETASLEAYRQGLESYKVAAQGIFNVAYDDVTKDQRQVGKVSDLALGYGGGIGAYVSMARGYRIDLETLPDFVLPHATEGELKKAQKMAKMFLKRGGSKMSLDAAMACDVIKQKWRQSHPAIERFWRGLENAAKRALESPGQIFSYRNIRFGVNGGFLKCLIPSGRVLHYFNPSLEKEREEDAPHPEPCMCEVCVGWKSKITYWGMKVVDGKTTRQWTQLSTYGGKLVENVVQAFCRDILAEAMLRLEATGRYPLVLHVHDEAVAEVPEGTGSLEEFNKIMEIVPPWAAGMPIESDGWVGCRYRK